MLETKIISAMEKCFLDQTPADFPVLERIRMYKNERATVQFAVYDPDESDNCCHLVEVKLYGTLAKYATMHTVENIVNYAPSFTTPKRTRELDPTFLRTEPGLYPDVLAHPMNGSCMPLVNQQLHTAYIDFEGDDLEPGVYPTEIAVVSGNTVLQRAFVEITVMDALLPAQDTRITNWFYADCLADYYNVPVWSDRHFEICDNFMRTAVKNGINLILMPVFTVALDTHVGGERTTTQLVQISRDNGVYSFDFSLCDRWIEICRRVGVKYYEISHLFSQWGAAHAPKVMVTVDGEYKRLFGWDTDASGAEYVTFIRAFLKEFTAYMENQGLKEYTYFHISDEPGGDHLAQYKKNRETVDMYLSGWKILDALSHVEFYREGLLPIPVPSSGVIEDFMKEDIKERWVYYCCGPWIGASNRFVAMTLSRTRSLGMQMYKYGIEGFLHWGYNFYNNCGSYDHVNPFLNPAAGYWGITGDAHVVYPGQDGKPLDSLRLRAFKAAIDDIRVMKLAESLYDKETVVAEMEKLVGSIDFMHCVNDASLMQKLRDRLDDIILAKL